MCVFRFKLWWMTQRMGTNGKEIPCETQFLIVEANQGSDLVGTDQSASYVVFLPILEGDFRAVLQGNVVDELEICLESGKLQYFHQTYILIHSTRFVMDGYL